MKDIVYNAIGSQIENLKNLRQTSYSEDVLNAAKILVKCLKNKNKILIAGNGGSAADAQHFAAELVGRFLIERRGLAAIALTTDTSIITSVGNDYSFDDIFSRQIEALGICGDVFIGISTSGNSKNIINCIEKSKLNGMKTICLLGRDGGKLATLCDYPIIIPFDFTPRIQEVHTFTVHLLCEIIENNLFSKKDDIDED